MPIVQDLTTHEIEAQGRNLAELDVEEAIAALVRHGWLHFRGFQSSIDDFKRFTGRFGACSAIRRAVVRGDALGYHAEDGYNPFRPDALWFYGRSVGDGGGTPTVVCDGVALFDLLPAETKAFLRANRIRYDRQYDLSMWQGATGSRRAEDLEDGLRSIADLEFAFLGDGSLHIGYEVPLVTQTEAGEEVFASSLLLALTRPEFYGISLSAGGDIPAHVIAELEKAAAIREVGIAWEAGDIFVVDNRRMMHRRADYHLEGRDLRVCHTEKLGASPAGPKPTRIFDGLRALIQSEVGFPTRVGRPEKELERQIAGRSSEIGQSASEHGS